MWHSQVLRSCACVHFTLYAVFDVDVVSCVLCVRTFVAHCVISIITATTGAPPPRRPHNEWSGSVFVRDLSVVAAAVGRLFRDADVVTRQTQSVCNNNCTFVYEVLRLHNLFLLLSVEGPHTEKERRVNVIEMQTFSYNNNIFIDHRANLATHLWSPIYAVRSIATHTRNAFSPHSQRCVMASCVYSIYRLNVSLQPEPGFTTHRQKCARACTRARSAQWTSPVTEPKTSLQADDVLFIVVVE